MHRLQMMNAAKENVKNGKVDNNTGKTNKSILNIYLSNVGQEKVTGFIKNNLF